MLGTYYSLFILPTLNVSTRCNSQECHKRYKISAVQCNMNYFQKRAMKVFCVIYCYKLRINQDMDKNSKRQQLNKHTHNIITIYGRL